MMRSQDLSLLAKVIMHSYWECARLATNGLIKNWRLLVGAVGAYVVFVISTSLLSPFGYGGLLILGLIHIALLSQYYSWVSETVQREKLKFENMLRFDYALFFNLISVAFLLSILEFFAAQLSRGIADWVPVLLRFGLVVVFNALPETVYIQRYESMQALQESMHFTIKNWIEWYLPFFIMLVPVLLVDPLIILSDLSSMHPLLTATTLIKVPSFIAPELGLIAVLVGVILANWFVLFRAHLFKELESGTRRMRMFNAKNK